MDKEYLWQKLSKPIQSALLDDQVFEITLNPDYSLWVTSHLDGCHFVSQLEEAEVSALVNALSQSNLKYLNHTKPFLDCTLPFHNERVCITVPPITDGVSFNIRKHSQQIFTLADYVSQGVMSSEQAEILKMAIQMCQNILVSGGPGSGKTTLTNALLDAMADVVSPGHRVLLLEQIPELQCRVANHKRMLTTDSVDLRTLLWIAMRNSPDRIIVGEVRDGAALDMLKAWNTGCPGGLATIHANSPEAALQRVVDLSLEAIHTPPYRLTVEAIDLVVQLNRDSRCEAGRTVAGIVQLIDYQDGNFIFENVG